MENTNMYYLSNFAYSDPEINKPNMLYPLAKKVTNKVGGTFGQIPFLKQQATDYLKVKGQEFFKETTKNKKPNLKQKMKMGKAYLKYRKHLGDTYGKDQGLSILENQKNYLKNLINPSYKQIPLE